MYRHVCRLWKCVAFGIIILKPVSSNKIRFVCLSMSRPTHVLNKVDTYSFQKITCYFPSVGSFFLRRCCYNLLWRNYPNGQFSHEFASETILRQRSANPNESESNENGYDLSCLSKCKTLSRNYVWLKNGSKIPCHCHTWGSIVSDWRTIDTSST